MKCKTCKGYDHVVVKVDREESDFYTGTRVNHLHSCYTKCVNCGEITSYATSGQIEDKQDGENDVHSGC